MTRRIVTAALALAVLVPTLASAQDRPRNRTRDRDRSEWQARVPARLFSFNRARLGVTVQTKADPETDRYGAKIVSVIEDGPAADAGIREGDIITKFGSTSLGGVKPEGRNDDDDDTDISGPGLKLVELAQELESGDTVRVEYRRDGRSHTATIVAEEIESRMSFRQFSGPDMSHFEGPTEFKFFGEGPGGMGMIQGGPGNIAVFMGSNLGLQMIEMNSDLGEYFGTNEGLLVIKTSGDSATPLRAGDVILTIDGRKPTSVSQALRIIGTYESGETVKAEVMRKRQRMNVEWTVPKREGRVRSVRPSRAPEVRELRPTRDRVRM